MSAPTIDDLPRLVEGDARLVHRGRRVTTTFLLEVGTEAHLVHVTDGHVSAVEHGPFPMPSWTFALRAPADAWAAFWSPTPPPGWNDLFAMAKQGALRVEGDLHPFMSNLLYFKGVLGALRATA